MALCSLGKIDKKYLLLLLFYLALNIVNYFCVSYFTVYSIHKGNDGNDDNIYLIFFVFLNFFGESLMFIPYFFFEKEKKIKDTSNEDNEKRQSVEYIFNNPYETNFSNKEITFLFICCLLSVIYQLLTKFKLLFQADKKNKNIYDLITNDEYTLFSSVFMFIISARYFKYKYYSHQYFSIIVITISGMVLFIIRCIITESTTFFFISIVTSLLCSIIYGYKKLLMDFKFFSIYKTSYVFGIVNSLLIAIIYFIFSFFSCEYEVLCRVAENDDKTSKHYIDNIIILLKNFTFKKAIRAIIISISNGMSSIIINYILSRYTPFHTILPLIVSQNVNDIIWTYWTIKDNVFTTSLIITIVLLYIINFFIIFVFLEGIELHCFGLDKNIKKNIKERAKEDLLLAGTIEYDSDDEEEDKKNQELLEKDTCS